MCAGGGRRRLTARIWIGLATIAMVVLMPAACAPDSPGPLEGPAPAFSEGTRDPNFNLQVVLRGEGFGVLKFRQRLETPFLVFLDISVRGLEPNASYVLQRAVDTDLDGVCTGAAWLTLGQGPTPHPIVMDERGAGRAALFRALPPSAGLTFDIHFRVVAETTGAVVLESGCYEYAIQG